MEEERSYLTVEEVQRDLGVGKNNIYKIFARNDFPANRLTRPFSIDKRAYSEWKMQRHDKKEE